MAREMVNSEADPDWEFRRWFPPEPSYLFIARRGVREFAERCGFVGRDLDDIESALGEALANAVEHGPHTSSGVTVRATFSDDGLVVEIHDGGPGFERDKGPREIAAESRAPRGYGILVMRRLMDRVTFGQNGSLVQLFKRLSVNP
jgi:anti-sigma regulatory factor (Ser/Thr protein kinase)